MSVSPTEARGSITTLRHRTAHLDTVAIVLAGGEGSRLRPLTDQQCKPAVPFVGSTRIVDFAIANLANSGIRQILVLAQYKPESLVEHLVRHWGPVFASTGRSLQVVMPRSASPADRFRGTADAVARSSAHWLAPRPRWVAIFAADHVYRMDVAQMLEAHRRSGAGITVAAMPVPLAEASAFGVLRTGPDDVVVGFDEKPAHPCAMPGRPEYAYASMGSYVFDFRALRESLRIARARGHVDFGRDILPAALGRERVVAYDFTTNRIPGVASAQPYWRDVGTLASLELARAEVSSPDAPIRIEDPVWPIRPLAPQPGAARVEAPLPPGAPCGTRLPAGRANA